VDFALTFLLTQWLRFEYVFQQICVAEAQTVQANIALDASGQMACLDNGNTGLLNDLRRNIKMITMEPLARVFLTFIMRQSSLPQKNFRIARSLVMVVLEARCSKV